MKSTGGVQVLDFDRCDDSSTMSVFEEGEGKLWFETVLMEKLGGKDERFKGMDVRLGERLGGRDEKLGEG